MILPLDTHAHIRPDIAPAELLALRSCVIAVTRTLDEYTITRNRHDPCLVWGAGCHPGLVREVKGFSPSRMAHAVETTPVIGEIGLDGAARTPMDAQLRTFRAVLALAADTPRLLSIHSYRATGEVLRQLRKFRPPAAVLHWWLGSPEETETALETGAYFSVNASQATRWESLSLVPLDRLLLETDHPFGDRSQPQPRRPGNVSRPEGTISAKLGLNPNALRRQTWRNLRGLADKLDLLEMFPRDFQVQFLAT